jgi:molybdopterin/thiamine biosynthesis adenylyltransferase
MKKEEGIREKINKASEKKKLPDKTPYTGISLISVKDISVNSGLNPLEIEIAALEMKITPERYVRNMKSFSPDDQAILLKSKASIVGLGGLGGTVVEILARAGIGTLNLIDGDVFEESNLNRQYLCREILLATSKAEAAAERVREINSSVKVTCHSKYLNEKNAAALIKGSDVVIDCLDSLPGRFVLEKASKKAGCRLVSAAVGGSFGQVTTIFSEDRGLKLIYGDPENVPVKGAEASIGALSFCVSLIASLEASEAIKILLNRGSLLRNRLLVVDLESNSFETMKLL